MRFLSRMNGWQRLWFVLTALSLIIFGIFYPYYETYKFNYSSYSYRESVAKDIQSSRCNIYINQPFNKLIEPQFGEGGSCWHLYTTRKYDDKDIYPYSLSVYDAKEKSRKLQMFFSLAALFSGLVLAGSALGYFAGFLISWIRRGFTQTA